jgi:hypothetical protein
MVEHGGRHGPPAPPALRVQRPGNAARVPVCRIVVAALGLAATVTAASTARTAAALPDDATLQAWVAEMKTAPRGPFKDIRWFCADGTVLPPRESCGPHGGGIQHGAWTDRVVVMRTGGFVIATVLAELDGETFTGPEADQTALKQVLLERFLMGLDDGWIFRHALTYRGALQAEDEQRGARRVVDGMLSDPAWRADRRFFPLRETARLLPVDTRGSIGAATRVRQLAGGIAARDRGFDPLRVKIHGLPDAGDSERVRAYANRHGSPRLAANYALLADEIEALYAVGAAADEVQALAAETADPKLAAELDRQAARLAAAPGPSERLAVTSHLLGLMRYNADRWKGAREGLALMRASLVLETETYAAGNTLGDTLSGATRRQRLAWLRDGANGLYGVGLVTKRHRDGVHRSCKLLEDAKNPTLDAYREELRYLARAPEWAGRTLAFHFSPSVEHVGRIEPLARLYPQDRLRASPLLFYGAVAESLVTDGNRLAGVEHLVFGEPVGVALRALNPGIARGVIRVPSSLDLGERYDPDGIYLLPETTASLPPVAGILTRGEGSSLSHVQLLARNLGIPNVVVGESLLPQVRTWDGRRAVLAVSPGGVVHIADDGPLWDGVFGTQEPGAFRITADLDRLDLDNQELVPLSRLRARDSGRIAGPKSANLGELAREFGDAVPDGFVIPFGVFRALLDRPLEPGGGSVFEWMKQSYEAIAARDADPDARRRATSVFLARVRNWIETVYLGADFHDRLTAQLRETFGPDGTYGVFVRSDTNVEDLPGFTGAGLNLTVPNVVGVDNIIRAIREVWASPFTERSYAWRQAHMDNPAFVFPAVLIQEAVAAEKSGVMVTADVEGGRRHAVTVAVNEGVGGAVAGQAAESLLVETDTGVVLFLAQATARERQVLNPRGGLVTVPTSGTQAVLRKAEIEELVRVARLVPSRFPWLRGEEGEPVPADIEFAFRSGRLALLQIRPFVENKNARRSQYLAKLDATARARGSQPVPLDERPWR